MPTFKWHVSKFEPNQPISLQITVIKVKLLLQIFKTMEKSEFCVLIKHRFLMGKNTVQAKQWFDKCYSDSAPMETMVKRWYADLKCDCTNTMMINAQVAKIQQLSWKTPKNSNSFWPIIN